MFVLPGCVLFPLLQERVRVRAPPLALSANVNTNATILSNKKIKREILNCMFKTCL
jgi:hypothetical protein